MILFTCTRLYRAYNLVYEPTILPMRHVNDTSPLVVVSKVLEYTAQYYFHRHPFYLENWHVELLSEWWDAEALLEERIGGTSDLSLSLRRAFENGTGDSRSSCTA